MRLNKFNSMEINHEEQQKINGGFTLDELIQTAWDATPEGGSSTWTNQGTSFHGIIRSSSGTTSWAIIG